MMSASPEIECSNTKAMIGLVKEQTEQALSENDLSLIRDHAFKALNTIESSRAQLRACGCEHARKNIMESLENLKLSTHVTTPEGTRIPLSRALEYIAAAREALQQHPHKHDPPIWQEPMAIEDPAADQDEPKRVFEEERILEMKIEEALRDFEQSLNDVVEVLPCEEALRYIRRVYAHSHDQLERAEQTPAKRIYNLRTKEIAEIALGRLRECNR
jgi:hypothetical protein